MSGWSCHTGRAAVLRRGNIDTDQLIPARFMSRSRAEGYGGFLLYDLREDPAVARVLDPVLGASVWIAGRNFGSGSSREAAVYALVDFGVRVVAAPSFGDIFTSNAVNNGLLPIALQEAEIERLAGAAATRPEAEVDLRSGLFTIGGETLRFDLPEIARTKLLNGWDDIDLTRDRAAEIAAYRAARARLPWAWPADAPGDATP